MNNAHTHFSMPPHTAAGSSITVNERFLQFYLDVMIRMTETFAGDKGQDAFGLFSMMLRECVPGENRKAAIDNAMQEMERRIANGEFGDMGHKNREFIKGFCIVGGCISFLVDAFKITVNDGVAMADMTDDELLLQLEKHTMFTKVRRMFSTDKDRMREMERRISSGEIPNLGALLEEAKAPDEDMPQTGEEESPVVEGIVE